uniref:hypothetical protein n=1 Tax=Rhodochorton tenue TaxID=173034 RepID=UPI002A82667B|nr:hypothetical protein UYM82_pgp188 [Rhodochorton tenue]WOK79385.1 hypothetical protein [Rhodochorton tenue]
MEMKIHQVEQKFNSLCKLLANNENNSSSTKIALIQELASVGPEGRSKLLSLILKQVISEKEPISFIYKYMYEILLQYKDSSILSILSKNFPSGIVPLESDLQVDYMPLQQLLLRKQFQEADQLTQDLLCKLSQIKSNHSRSWLYFTDIAYLPATDLKTIDQLWRVHSLGLFGMSVQRKIWLCNNSDWEKFWYKIGWTVNNSARRYPQEFIWSVTAPKGHLPLFNQLRGVQVLAALFTHPVWGEQE